MNIRPMVETEAEAVMTMRDNSDIENGYKLSDASKQQILLNLRAYAKHDQCTCFVAEEGGELVGFITCAMRSHPVEPGYMGDIEEVYVQPAYRNQEIDKSLLEQAVGYLKSLGAKVIETKVDKADSLSCKFWNAQKWNQEMLIYAIYSDPGDEAEQAVWDRY